MSQSSSLWSLLCDWRLGEGRSGTARACCLSCHVGGVDWVILWESKVPFTAARGVIHRAPLGSTQGGYHTLSLFRASLLMSRGESQRGTEETWQCRILCAAIWVVLCSSVDLKEYLFNSAILSFAIFRRGWGLLFCEASYLTLDCLVIVCLGWGNMADWKHEYM